MTQVWKEIFRFEIGYHLRQPLFWVTTLGFLFFFGTAASSDMGVAMSHAADGAARNAPYVIVGLQTGISAFGVLVLTAFVASSVLRDFKLDTHELFFTKPLSKSQYLLGRFAGSSVVSTILLAITALGLLAMVFVPWQEADRLGPVRLAPYLFGFFVMVLPNLLWMGAVFFALAALTRSLFGTYIAVIAFVFLQEWAEMLGRDMEQVHLASLIEPLGIIALEKGSQYWTLAEYDTLLPPLSSALLLNRLVWLGVGAAFLFWAWRSFSYDRATAPRFWRRRQRVVR